MQDLGPRARVAFAGLWVVAQAALVLTGAWRSDSSFAFRMFPEASLLEIHLVRVTSAGDVAAPRGEWSARDAAGQLRHFSWRDRVRDPILGTLDARVFASYGVSAQLARLGRALDDGIDHLEEDSETRQLRAEVTFWKNGRDPEYVTLSSRARR